MTTIGGPNRANRRLSARFTCRLAVSYNTGAEWHPATGMDLSSNGCRLRLGEDLPRASPLKVRFERPGTASDLMILAELEGTVIWSRLEGLSYQVGIQFIDGDRENPELQRMLQDVGVTPQPPTS
jgi:hypothetical protein